MAEEVSAECEAGRARESCGIPIAADATSADQTFADRTFADGSPVDLIGRGWVGKGPHRHLLRERAPADFQKLEEVYFRGK